MNEARSEAKKATKSPTSSGLPNRLMGILLIVSRIRSSKILDDSLASNSKDEAKKLVSTGPDTRLLTVMLNGASSLASIFE